MNAHHIAGSALQLYVNDKMNLPSVKNWTKLYRYLLTCFLFAMKYSHQTHGLLDCILLNSLYVTKSFTAYCVACKKCNVIEIALHNQLLPK